MARLVALFAGALALAALAAGPAAAALTPTITAYPTDSASSAPYAIVAGPDGAVWFTELNGREIGRMTVDGTLRLHAALPGGSSASYPYGITAGSDGAMWFVAQSPSIVGRIDGSGSIQTKALASTTANPTHIVSGPDGALWFTEGVTKAIGRIPALTPLFTPDESRTTADAPNAIASGSDGNLWFTEYSAQMIGRMTPAGPTTYLPVTPSTANPEDITAGPDGGLWYTEINPMDVVRLANDGTQTPIPLPSGVYPWAITAGPDGALWIAGGDAVARMTTGGLFQTFPLPSGTGVTSITTGPDGNVWFNEENPGQIGRITTPPIASTTGASATGPTSAKVTGTANGHAQATSFHIEYGPIGRPTTTTPEQSLGTTSGDTPVSGTLSGLSPSTAYQARVVVTNATDTTPGAFLSFVTPASLTSQLPAVLLSPALSGLTLNPTAFAAAPHGPSALAASAGAAKKTGTLISYRDSEAATTTFTVLQSEAGVRVRGRCVKAPRHPVRGRRRCQRLVPLGTFTHADLAGSDRLRFTGRVRGRKLKPGPYQLRAVARNSAGKTGAPVTKSFRIIR